VGPRPENHLPWVRPCTRVLSTTRLLYIFASFPHDNCPAPMCFYVSCNDNGPAFHRWGCVDIGCAGDVLEEPPFPSPPSTHLPGPTFLIALFVCSRSNFRNVSNTNCIHTASSQNRGVGLKKAYWLRDAPPD
jgi:hypothetical protein